MYRDRMLVLAVGWHGVFSEGPIASSSVYFSSETVDHTVSLAEGPCGRPFLEGWVCPWVRMPSGERLAVPAFVMTPGAAHIGQSHGQGGAHSASYSPPSPRGARLSRHSRNSRFAISLHLEHQGGKRVC